MGGKMHDSFRTETVETDAGPYKIDLFFDDDSSNPLDDWDNPGMAFLVQWSGYGGRWDTGVDTLDAVKYGTTEPIAPSNAVSILRAFIAEGHNGDEVARRYALWRNISESVNAGKWALVNGQDSASQSNWYRWFALVDTTEDYGPNGWEAAVNATMSTYNQFAQGMVAAYEVTTPDGDVLDSVGGFYEDDEAIGQARAIAESDAAERVDASNLVGAGFVGII